MNDFLNISLALRAAVLSVVRGVVWCHTLPDM